MSTYGKELILDLHNCKFERVTQDYLTCFLEELVARIGMQAEKLTFWEYDDEEEYHNASPHLKGISGVQFISTSNITIHALDEMKRVYLNIFSCKDFKSSIVKEYAIEYFQGTIVNATAITRI